MQRRDSAADKAVKARRRKTLKRRNAPKIARRRKPSAADANEKIALLEHRLRESLQQQTATSEVLKVISSSPNDLEPVFQAVLANATRICGAKFGTLYLYEGDAFYATAFHNAPLAFVEARKNRPLHPAPDSTLGRAAKTKQVAQILDSTKGEAYRQGDPFVVAGADLGGYRTIVSVPMLKEDELIGVISIYRQEVRSFSDKQIELVQNFAAQAVIAIENTRLLSELRESLQQQTATADVLKVISSSPGELEPVFRRDAGERNAHLRGQVWRATPLRKRCIPPGVPCTTRCRHGLPTSIASPASCSIHPSSFIASPTAKTSVHAADDRLEANPVPPTMAWRRSNSSHRSDAQGERLIGAIVIYRQEVRPFTDKQIELVKTSPPRPSSPSRTRGCSTSCGNRLQQQTATADVLKVISRSTFDLQTVLDTLVESAARLCEADMASINRERGTAYLAAANMGHSPRISGIHGQNPIAPGRPGTLVGRVTLKANGSTFPMSADPDFEMTGAARLGGIHTMLGVPLLREGTPIGVIVLQRKAVRPFTEKQIELVETFADQAVIAIENVRLFESVEARTRELSEALEQQAATAEVLNVISRSKFDLQPILQSVVDTAARLCRADTAVIFRLDQAIYRFAAGYCVDPQYMEIERATPITPGPGTVVGRAAMRREVVQIVDAMEDPQYEKKKDAEIAQVRSMIGVPLMREGEPIGVIALARQRVEPFVNREIDLVSTFADQAAIAIENVRLFESVEARTRELAKSLEDLRTAQDRLVQTEKLASLGQLTAGIAHEIKNPLNFVNNFSAISVELIDELRDALAGANLDNKLRAQISEIADTLQGNLDKVVQHGKRADAIVKNMLLHSRQSSGERRPIDINTLVEESLNLAYHGARAEKQGFNITLERSFDPTAGEADVFPQEITRVLLNLISNGFYAATKRKAETNGGNYEPTLAAATKNLGDSVEIRIRDNGTGIPPEVKEKMFNPFFTTKPVGEGTGLGLSLSYDIIVKQHAGSIEVDTQPGEFTEFRIVLPRGAATIAKSGERP